MYNRYQQKAKFSDFKTGGISSYYLSLPLCSGNLQKWRLPYRRAFVWLSIWKQIHAPVFSGPSENGFIWSHLLEHQCRRGLTTSKTRDAFVKRKAVAIPMWVMRLYGRWRLLSIEIQGNMCRREAMSYRCQKRMCGKFYADRFAWNLTMPRYETTGLGKLELQMKSG
jgi:hypothetical protein